LGIGHFVFQSDHGIFFNFHIVLLLNSTHSTGVNLATDRANHFTPCRGKFT
jgi:hypothetical protein